MSEIIDGLKAYLDKTSDEQFEKDIAALDKYNNMESVYVVTYKEWEGKEWEDSQIITVFPNEEEAIAFTKEKGTGYYYNEYKIDEYSGKWGSSYNKINLIVKKMEEKDLKENVIEERTRQWMKNFPVILATNVYRNFLEYIAYFAPKDFVNYSYYFLSHKMCGHQGGREIKKCDDKELYFLANNIEIPCINYEELEDGAIDVVLSEEDNKREGWLMFPTRNGYYECFTYVDYFESEGE